MPELIRIHIYPIKGTQALNMREALVQPRGLEHDRRWMLVDETGTCITQREHARLGLIQGRVVGTSLEVQAPSMERLSIPCANPEGVRQRVAVWDDVVMAATMPDAAHSWFSRYLGVPCRLVYMDSAARRPLDPSYAPNGGEVSFADGYPLLLTSEASLADLNARMDAPVPMSRFRPNLVVTGLGPFAEDHWSLIRIGEMVFHVAKPCARCVVTTIDQQTAVGGKEPLRTLNLFRKYSQKVYFGENLIPAEPGIVRVGDKVEVLKRRSVTAF